MIHLSKKQKSELLKAASSAGLKRDFDNMRKISVSQTKKSAVRGIDGFIKFLNLSNLFANHRKKRLERMSGDNFIL